jgi:hypothetical protein
VESGFIAALGWRGKKVVVDLICENFIQRLWTSHSLSSPHLLDRDGNLCFRSLIKSKVNVCEACLHLADSLVLTDNFFYVTHFLNVIPVYLFHINYLSQFQITHEIAVEHQVSVRLKELQRKYYFPTHSENPTLSWYQNKSNKL